MLGKLDTKLKREVQQRIESQRKLHAHLHSVGEVLEERLLKVFDQEIGELGAQVLEVEERLDGWEPSVLKGLTENTQRVKSFENECAEAFGVMRNSLQDQYRKTEMYEQ